MLSRYIIRKQDWGRHELSIERDGLTIGSAFENDLLLNHPTVSRTHAGICEVAGLFWLTNLSKSNGTLVNGKLTDLTYLDTGDTIQIGVFLVRTTVRQHELILEVERYFDSFTAGNRGAQLLTDPGLTITEGPATVLMENG
ncbi:MAG TPA: FHA domain-containing protein, partial [Acidobacteriota bacterium]|nr:FHA domain-containing protein [Acidobacteriota bacterium]